MRARGVTRLVVGAFALAGAAAVLALWSGRLQLASEPAPQLPGRALPAGEDVAPGAPPHPPALATAPGPPVAVPPAATSPTPAPLARYRVCTASGAIRLLRIAGTPRPRYLVHCGASLELIGFDVLGTHVEPRRVAHLELSVPEPGLGAEPGGLASGDLDGDGLADLLIGSVLRDDRETLGGGRIHWLRGSADGAFASPRRLSDAPATELAFQRRVGAAAASLVALRAAESRLGEPAQLWTYAPGAAPLRQSKIVLGPSASALGAVDLNLDGHDELFSLLGAPASVRKVALDAEATDASTEIGVPDAAPRELRVGDLDGDGHADLLVLGDELTWLAASATAESEPSPRVLFQAAALRDLQLVDATGDARLDLVAYAHPELLALEHRPDGSFVRRSLYRRQSAALGTLSLRVDELDDDVQPELLLFGSSEGEPGGIELVVIPDPAIPERLAETSLPLLDAPLSLRSTLP